MSAGIRAQRARLGLLQSDISKRMNDLGFSWYSQTVGLLERGQRPLLAEELIALAVALDCTPEALYLPPAGTQSVQIGGYAIPAGRLSAVDGTTSYFGNELRINPRRQKGRSR